MILSGCLRWIILVLAFPTVAMFWELSLHPNNSIVIFITVHDSFCIMGLSLYFFTNNMLNTVLAQGF